MNYIEDLISQANATENSHRIIPSIYLLAFAYFLAQGIYESLAKDAAEAVSKTRRSDLDLANLRRALVEIKEKNNA